MTAVQKELFSMQDEAYRLFQAKLMPTVDMETIIGVRTPALRKFAKTFAKSDEAAHFLQTLPHRYYEENNLHAFLVEQIRDFDACIAALDAFLPYVDNWATCDSMAPKVLGKHKEKLPVHIRRWLSCKETYTVRFAVGLLMRYFLDDSFSPEYLQWVASLDSDAYYIRMMAAWYFATALAKQYEAALPVLQNGVLETWTHNKAIQKALESYRITPEQKAYLRTLRRNGKS
ncbi:MAG: DNA alkylation repair protein [Acutalibacteraceae bacterium]